MSGGNFPVRLPRLRQGKVAGQGDDAVKLRIEALQAVQIDPGQALGGNLALLIQRDRR